MVNCKLFHFIRNNNFGLNGLKNSAFRTKTNTLTTYGYKFSLHASNNGLTSTALHLNEGDFEHYNVSDYSPHHSDVHNFLILLKNINDAAKTERLQNALRNYQATLDKVGHIVGEAVKNRNYNHSDAIKEEYNPQHWGLKRTYPKDMPPEDTTPIRPESYNPATKVTKVGRLKHLNINNSQNDLDPEVLPTNIPSRPNFGLFSHLNTIKRISGAVFGGYTLAKLGSILANAATESVSNKIEAKLIKVFMPKLLTMFRNGNSFLRGQLKSPSGILKFFFRHELL